jgi:hypothetical protein
MIPTQQDSLEEIFIYYLLFLCFLESALEKTEGGRWLVKPAATASTQRNLVQSKGYTTQHFFGLLALHF